FCPSRKNYHSKLRPLHTEPDFLSLGVKRPPNTNKNSSQPREYRTDSNTRVNVYVYFIVFLSNVIETEHGYLGSRTRLNFIPSIKAHIGTRRLLGTTDSSDSEIGDGSVIPLGVS